MDTICLTVNNVELAGKWYQEMLELKESYQGDGYRIYSFAEGGVPLTIEEGNMNKTSPTQHHVYPIFFSKDIAKTYETLKEKGVNVEEIQHDGVNTFFDFYDLDGNRLQVCYFE